MKKLSEIGSNVWPYPNLGGEPKCYMLTEPAGDGHVMQILLTQDERRELVQNAIYAFIMDHVDSYLAKDSLGNCVERLFKEQEL